MPNCYLLGISKNDNFSQMIEYRLNIFSMTLHKDIMPFVSKYLHVHGRYLKK